MQLTTAAPDGLDVDLLNALRLWMMGTDLNQHETQVMAEPMFDALAFAHANPVEQFIGTAEWSVAFQESIVDLIGVTHWFG